MSNNPLHQRTNRDVLSFVIGPQAADSVCARFPTLTEICKADRHELEQLTGLGAFRVTQLLAALELAGRLSREVLGESPVLDTPEQIAALVRDDVRPYRTETFQVVLLNTRKRLIRVVDIASGTLDTLLVHAREVFRHAITSNAASVVLIHNHPSGDPTPSEADAKVTRDLIRAGQLLKIEVIDHIIMGQATPERSKDYVSLRELGYFYS